MRSYQQMGAGAAEHADLAERLIASLEQPNH
jgi:hypothetical protein